MAGDVVPRDRARHGCPLALFYDDVHRTNGRLAGILGAALHRELLEPSASGYDRFVRGEVQWSLGMRVEGGEIGMGGIGGSSGWYAAGPDYAMSYVTRGLADHSRADAVADAVESALSA
ncbi:hypothetical protein GCM10010988_20730 [Cnuibacter physcomitrellae]|uniref:hypothetical protein n=1 Tax=Cnuibacter physcomitrellae TaxID=1619308 RepID=UPI0019AB0B82|nr:hypothetical protein [Cnuibacter physcomitrellae]GGI38770.1 hypothetical protein GCM10010988_20730 [Cnuibacter physcomitrellae]